MNRDREVVGRCRWEAGDWNGRRGRGNCDQNVKISEEMKENFLKALYTDYETILNNNAEFHKRDIMQSVFCFNTRK